MKVHSLFIKSFIIVMIFTTTIFAQNTLSGSIESGDVVFVKPQNNHAFSVTKSKDKSHTNASYNVSLINGSDIIYEDKNLVDDIYLIFHDDILEGDRMKIEVNEGYFDYKVAPVLELPTIVKDVIAPQVLQKAKNFNKEKEKIKKELSRKKELAKDVPVVEKASKVKNYIQAPVIEEDVITLPPLEEDSKISDNVHDKKAISSSFFKKFTEIFKNIVKSLSFTPSVKKETTNKVKAAVIKESKKVPSVPDFKDTNLPKNLEADFKAPKRGLREDFDDSALLSDASIEKKSFDREELTLESSQLPSGLESKFSAQKSQQPRFNQESYSNKLEATPRFNATKKQLSIDDTLASRASSIEELPHFSKKEAPRFSQTDALLAEKKVAFAAPREMKAPVNTYYDVKPDAIPVFSDKTAAYPDTGYKEEYQELQQSVTEVVKQPQRARVVEDTSLPQMHRQESEDKSEKLVITKIIDKDVPQADPFAGRVLGNIDDRRAKGGYNGAATTGKLGMRVTRNAREVSAWIEVFKNGTKSRVKTFYSSGKRKTKKVKLPAGNYTVKATYRTRDNKYQKTIRNIRLKAGANITRSIAFHDGTLRVVARRGDGPSYVKVVANKSGSHKPAGYTFSSRTSGIAELSLPSGSYDIEVAEHNDVRTFYSQQISSGQTHTINVDF